MSKFNSFSADCAYILLIKFTEIIKIRTILG